jgi:hypothetical protein
MNKKTRKTKWKTPLSKADWKIVLEIDGGRIFFLDPNTGVRMKDELGRVSDDNKVILGTNGIHVTLITPLQSQKRGNIDSVRVQDVVSDIICKRGAELGLNMNSVKEVTEQFTDKKKNVLAKIELHRCRMRCEFLDAFNGNPICDPVRSEEIRNVKQRDIGALELHEMSDPRASCTKGGFKVLISLMFKASTMKTNSGTGGPIKAVFVIVGKDGVVRHAESVYKTFNQISEYRVHDNTIAFIVPEQSDQVVRSMSRNKEVLRVALFRSHDKKYSMRRLPFVYVPHREGLGSDDDGACPFCYIRAQSLNDGSDFVNGELRKEPHACRHQKRRQTEEPTPVLSPAMSYAYSPSGESGISSPGWQPDDRQRRISSTSSSDVEGRQQTTLNNGVMMYNVPMSSPPNLIDSCSPNVSNSDFVMNHQPAVAVTPPAADNGMSPPQKFRRTEFEYTTLTPAAPHADFANCFSTIQNSPPPLTPALGTQPGPTMPYYTNYENYVVQDDEYPDLFNGIMTDSHGAGIRPSKSGSFEVVTPDMLRESDMLKEYRRKQDLSEMQFDSAMDETDHSYHRPARSEKKAAFIVCTPTEANKMLEQEYEGALAEKEKDFAEKEEKTGEKGANEEPQLRCRTKGEENESSDSEDEEKEKQKGENSDQGKETEKAGATRRLACLWSSSWIIPFSLGAISVLAVQALSWMFM